MRANHRMQRLYCDSPIAAAVAIALEPQQAHYLQNVLRMRDGSEVLLFNGRDGEWAARLRIESRKRLWLEPVIQTRPQPPAPDLHFCFAPLKTGRMDYLVQKATEMGAGVLRPVLTHHTQQSRFPADRMRANVMEAAEQCGILSVPALLAPVRFADLVAGWSRSRALVFCDEGAETRNPVVALQALRGQPAGVLVGPEGGFSPEERRELLQLPFVTAISLGPRILRADTAAVAALAAFQAAAGDW